MRRLLISAILALAVHATILGTECAWLKHVPAAPPNPNVLTISLGLRRPPGPPKAAVPIMPNILHKTPVLIKPAPPEPQTLPTASEVPQNITPRLLPDEPQPPDSHTANESTDLNDTPVPAVHAVQKVRPFYRKHPAPQYPRSARIKGYHGNVVLDVLVDRNGKVADLRMVKSSGYPILDEAAEAAVKNWLFEPGLIGKEKVDMWVRIPIRFELK